MVFRYTHHPRSLSNTHWVLCADDYTLGSLIKSRESRLNLGDAMDSAKVVVINNGIDLLGDEGCEFFGRFFCFACGRLPSAAAAYLTT